MATPAADSTHAGRMVSYAQNFEDVVLARAFAGRTDGFYIDVGANHPVTDSVTKHFYDLGWHGINIEPQSALHAKLAHDRPRDINLCVGAGAESGMLDLFEVEANHARSTFSQALHRQNATEGLHGARRQVPVTTLAEICRTHVTGEIDFLKVDVEGFEELVFRGNDWQQFRPKVILAEDNFAGAWHEFVEAQGYTQTVHDGINRFYVRNDLLAELGPVLNRPAAFAIDAFDPWLYVAHIPSLRAKYAIEATAVGGARSTWWWRRLVRPVAHSRVGRALRHRLGV